MTTPQAIPYIINDESITLIIKGQPTTIYNSECNYEDIIDAIKNDDWEKVTKLSSKKEQVKEYIKGDLVLKGNTIYFKEEPVHGYITKKIVSFLEEGLQVEPLLNFLEKLMQNPSKRCVDDLFKFLEQGNMPIDSDGDFYAYKAVRPNWKDKHSGTLDNSIGNTIQVARNKVDDNPDNACSHGLHAGSISYVNNFAGPGDKMIIVKINPADVVSVPSHDVRKLRCCRYIVVQEYKGLLPENTYETDDDDYDDPETLEDVFSEDDFY